MAYYGTDVFQDFSRKVFLPYGTYYSDANYNRLFKQALYNIVNQIYKNLAAEKEYEKLRVHIETGYNPTVTNNRIDLSSITNYDHLLALKSYMIAPETYSIDEVKTVGGVITVTFSNTSPLRTGEIIKLSAFMGLSGLYYAKRLSKFTYQIYTDKILKVPATPLAPYTTGGIQRVVDSWAKPIFSDRKISAYGRMTIYFPRYEYDGNGINILPTENQCIKVEMDYTKAGIALIDVTNGSTDLTAYYPTEMLNQITEEAARLFKIELGDPQQSQVYEAELLKRN